MFEHTTLRNLAGAAFLLLLGSCSTPENLYLQPTAEMELDRLISEMTLEEKVGQTCQVTLDALLDHDDRGGIIEPSRINSDQLREAIETYKVGSVLNVGWHSFKRAEWENIINVIQEPYRNGKSKTPILYGIDAIHGMNYTLGSTLFPHEIGLAATWSPQLIEACAGVTAYEVRASGIPWNFSPVLDLGRQPLWSRHFETFGEDPFLCAEMGAAMIRGYQGKGNLANDKVLACMKHFVGYSASTSGRDRTPAWIPEKYMRELYLPSFKKAVDEGAMTVMVNSGALNGIPGHANKYLLTDVLKNEWGFQGFAVSDWEDFIMLHTVHRTHENLADAYVAAFNAGVDMSMVPLSPQYKEYCRIMIDAVNNGSISEERLNDAVKRILRVKKQAGIFQKEPFNASNYPDFALETHRLQAKEAAVESITLLKNKDEVLPLNASTKVLLAGPTSDNLIYLNGSWTHTWQGSDTSFNTKSCLNIKQAFEQKLGKENVLFAKGVELQVVDGFERSVKKDWELYEKQLSSADVVVLCLGEYPSVEKPGDIRSLNLDSEQRELAKRAYAAGKKVVLVLVEGRPRIIHDIVEGAGAIVQCYLPGDYGAEALVDLVYGDANFSGKLPYTYPKYDGVIEFYDRPASVDRSKSGAFDAFDPEWPFGFGLSYSEVQYSNLAIGTTELTGDDSLWVSVDVSNLSDQPCKEIVQLYLSDEYASFIPAGQRLKGFQKIALAPGTKKTVRFKLTKEDLSFYNDQGEEMLENGYFSVRIQSLTTKFHYAQ
jgi:beta-glucosidase